MEEIKPTGNPLKGRLKALADEVIRLGCVKEVTSYNSFSLMCECSVSWIKCFNAKKIAPKTIGAIRRNFPMVNVDWLVTGEGNMFYDNYNPLAGEEDNNKTVESQVAVLFQQVADLLEQNRKLTEKVAELERKSGNLS